MRQKLPCLCMRVAKALLGHQSPPGKCKISGEWQKKVRKCKIQRRVAKKKYPMLIPRTNLREGVIETRRRKGRVNPSDAACCRWGESLIMSARMVAGFLFAPRTARFLSTRLSQPPKHFKQTLLRPSIREKPLHFGHLAVGPLQVSQHQVFKNRIKIMKKEKITSFSWLWTCCVYSTHQEQSPPSMRTVSLY